MPHELTKNSSSKEKEGKCFKISVTKKNIIEANHLNCFSIKMHKAPLGLFSIEKVNLNKRIEQTLVRKLALSCLFDNSFK